MEHTPKKTVVFIDSGDTLVEEATEIRDDRDVVLFAQLHAGCGELLLRLHREGFPLALVADGLAESFENIFRGHGLWELFSARAISSLLPDHKPAAVMFQTAMDELGLTDAHKPRVIMVGNNLARDIVGANRFGITSVLFDWSDRYDMQPKTPQEVPRYTVHTAQELYALICRLERGGE